MAKSLSAFMAQNAKKVENRKIVASTRFIGEDGKPMEWEICCITAGENQKLRKSCMRSVPVQGKRGQYTQEFDNAGYQAKLVTKCTVFPDLNDAELQESYGVMGAEQLISVMLTLGEFDEYLSAILDLNGFADMNDLVDEAKN
ncbi:phage tail assembly chaperone [Anaerovibrio slackiae]|uniref:phage tail assembly chaperone n=1 Tax=Anaerovibrio slackiae TaxID=2652309 RepID=UPI00386409DF